jgi:hypothetical protein
MKQTAVEWLVDQVEDFIGLIPVDIIEQAKEMEKEQIIEAHNCGYSEGIYQSCESGEEYYNETFKPE